MSMDSGLGPATIVDAGVALNVPDRMLLMGGLVGGQWVASEEWDVEFKIVTNEELPAIPIDGPLEPIVYS